MHNLSTESDIIKPLHTVSNLVAMFRLTIGSYAFYPIPLPTATGKQDAWKLTFASTWLIQCFYSYCFGYSTARILKACVVGFRDKTVLKVWQGLNSLER